MGGIQGEYLRSAFAAITAHDLAERMAIDRAALANAWNFPIAPVVISQPQLPPIQIHNPPQSHPQGLGLLGSILLIIVVTALSSVSVLGAVYYGRQLAAPQNFELQLDDNKVPVLEKK